MQAGMSGRGQRFAARWGELLFVAYSDVERSGSADRAKSKRFLYSVTHSRQAGYTRTMQQSFDTERNSMEWQLLTKFIDRHLLIVYFIGTMTAQIWLAYEMLGSHGDKVQGNTV